MGLADRVRQLEGGGKCTRCGWPPSLDEDVKVNFHWPDVGDKPQENEYCEECGRQTRVVLRWSFEEPR